MSASMYIVVEGEDPGYDIFVKRPRAGPVTKTRWKNWHFAWV